MHKTTVYVTSSPGDLFDHLVSSVSLSFFYKVEVFGTRQHLVIIYSMHCFLLAQSSRFD